jgi:hypothetical protein
MSPADATGLSRYHRTEEDAMDHQRADRPAS